MSRLLLGVAGIAGAAAVGFVYQLGPSPASDGALAVQGGTSSAVADTTFFQEGWRIADNPYPLPDWFEGNRVHGHTRLIVGRWYGTPEFEKAPEVMRAMGARVIVRHVKTKDEDPWWPSVAPHVRITPGERPGRAGRRSGAAIAADANIVKQVIDDTHRAGLRMIAYYWHMSDSTVQAQHPDWVCKGINRRDDAEHRVRGAYLDLTTPYRDVVLARLLELAEMGADGFYFDNQHLPDDGCFGTALERSFEQASGTAAPRNRRDAAFRLYQEYQALEIEETFAYWRDHVKERYPGVVFIVSTTFVPSLASGKMSTNLPRIVDSPKNEYSLAVRASFNPAFRGLASIPEPDADVRSAFGWAMLRDAADGRPPHIWTPGLATVEHAIAFAGSVMTYGAIANVGISEHNLVGENGERGTPREATTAALALGNRVSAHLAGMRPARWAAVHYGELSRNRRAPDAAKMWREVLWPVNGAFDVLVRERMPAGVVTDYQLDRGELDGYQLLYLPNPQELTPGQQRAVAQFEGRAGVVIRNRAEWGNRAAIDRARAALRSELIAARSRASGLNVRVVGGPERLHATTFTHTGQARVVIALSNDFTWVLEDRANAARRPAAVQGVEIQVSGHATPSRAIDAVTGRALQIRTVQGGFSVSVPEFSSFALIVLDP